MSGFWLIIIVVVPLFFGLISYIINNYFLRQKTLELLGGGSRFNKNYFWHWTKFVFKKAHFIVRIQVAYTTRSFGKFASAFVLFFGCSLIFLIQFNAKDLINNLANSYTNIYIKSVDHRYNMKDYFPRLLPAKNNKLNFTPNWTKLTNTKFYYDSNDPKIKQKINSYFIFWNEIIIPEIQKNQEKKLVHDLTVHFFGFTKTTPQDFIPLKVINMLQNKYPNVIKQLSPELRKFLIIFPKLDSTITVTNLFIYK